MQGEIAAQRAADDGILDRRGGVEPKAGAELVERGAADDQLERRRRLERVVLIALVQHAPVARVDRETADVDDAIPISQSEWCLLRAWSDKAEYPVLDAYPYATTSPIYVTVAGSVAKPSEDAAYFVAWIDRMIQDAKSNRDWNAEAEKASVLDLLNRAREVYVDLEK